jgi:hypothetical protein
MADRCQNGLQVNVERSTFPIAAVPLPVSNGHYSILCAIRRHLIALTVVIVIIAAG